MTRRYSRLAPTQNAAWQVTETFTPVTIEPGRRAAPPVATMALASAADGQPCGSRVDR